MNIFWYYRDIVNGGTCQFDPETNLPDANCAFFPNSDNDEIKSSLMAAPFLKSVDHFCEDTETTYHHDMYKPNKQNFMCNQKSTWDIIMESTDFEGVSPLNTTNPVPKTKFKILQPDTARYTLVLDRSNSMTDNGRKRFQMLKQSSKRWIQNELKTSSKLGITSFWYL